MVGIRRRRAELPDSEQEPNPDRIRELTAEIQRNWTARERRRRTGHVPHVELLEMSLEPQRHGMWPDLI